MPCVLGTEALELRDEPLGHAHAFAAAVRLAAHAGDGDRLGQQLDVLILMLVDILEELFKRLEVGHGGDDARAGCQRSLGEADRGSGAKQSVHTAN